LSSTIYNLTMRVIVALLFVLAVANAFVPVKFSAALLKAIQSKNAILSSSNSIRNPVHLS
jgi:hypothetical protein